MSPSEGWCKVCASEHRDAINDAIHYGAGLRSTMRQYPVAGIEVFRKHKRKCLQLALDQAKLAAEKNLDWAKGKLGALISEADAMLEECKGLGPVEFGDRIARSRELRGWLERIGDELERLGRLSGWVTQKVEVTLSQEWQDRVRAAQEADPEVLEQEAVAWLRAHLLRKGKRLMILGVNDEASVAVPALPIGTGEGFGADSGPNGSSR